MTEYGRAEGVDDEGSDESHSFHSFIHSHHRGCDARVVDRPPTIPTVVRPTLQFNDDWLEKQTVTKKNSSSSTHRDSFSAASCHDQKNRARILTAPMKSALLLTGPRTTPEEETANRASTPAAEEVPPSPRAPRTHAKTSISERELAFSR